jgi:nucleotide-binding universal stress UspA family protein
MKKIIVAFDGLRFSESTKEYSIYMAKHCNAHLVGVFLDDFTLQSYTYADVVSYGSKWEEKVKALDKQDQEKRNLSVQLFEDACRHAGLNYSIHHDKNIAFQDLLHETIFSDLLIISSNETFTNYPQPAPTGFLKDLLAEAECPVLVVPEKYKPIQKLVLLYDGKPSSVHALKMFSYLFPALKPLETDVITVKEEKQNLHLPDNKLMKEFVKRHFPDAKYIVLKGDAEEEIATYLKVQNADVLVVLGAYDRSMVSRWFKRSMADYLLANVNVPLFIAHKK